MVYEDDDGNTWEEEEDEEVTEKPRFELSLADQGEMEYVEYDKKGNVISRTAQGGSGGQDGEKGFDDDDDGLIEEDDEEDSDDDDDFDFTEAATVGGVAAGRRGKGSSWGQLSAASTAKKDAAPTVPSGSGRDEDYGEDLDPASMVVKQNPVVSALPGGGRKARGREAAAAAAKGGSKSQAAARDIEGLLGSSGAEGAAAGLLDGDELDDWGLDELEARSKVSCWQYISLWMPRLNA